MLHRIQLLPSNCSSHPPPQANHYISQLPFFFSIREAASTFNPRKWYYWKYWTSAKQVGKNTADLVLPAVIAWISSCTLQLRHVLGLWTPCFNQRCHLDHKGEYVKSQIKIDQQTNQPTLNITHSLTHGAVITEFHSCELVTPSYNFPTSAQGNIFM